MKRLIPLMLCCVVLLWGCGTAVPEKITAGCETASETTEQPDTVSSTQEPDTEAKLEAVREQLGDGACTFSLSQMFQKIRIRPRPLRSIIFMRTSSLSATSAMTEGSGRDRRSTCNPEFP